MTSPVQVREELHEIVDPCSAATGLNLDIVEMGMVKSVVISDGHVDVELRLTTPACHMIAYFDKNVRERVGSLPGVESVGVTVDDGLEWTHEMMSEEAKQRRRARLNSPEVDSA